MAYRPSNSVSVGAPLEHLPPERFETTAILKKLATASRNLAELKGVVASIPHQGIPINTLGMREAKDEIASHGYVLTPGRYVGAEEVEDDGIAFEEKMAGLSATLYDQFEESARLEAAIRTNLEGLGHGK